MRQGWESEAQNWAHFARTPGLDRAHEHINGLTDSFRWRPTGRARATPPGRSRPGE